MNFTNEFISCAISINGMNVNIKGTLNNPSLYKKKFVIAPTPSNQITSYSGSSLPFPNEEIAFQNTKNLFEIKDDGIIETTFQYPNSYYTPDGKTKIKSPILFIFDDNKFIIELEDLCPLKTLRDRKRSDPSFYALKEILLPIGTAEETMNNYSSAKIKYNIA
jgi:hypothetical protein